MLKDLGIAEQEIKENSYSKLGVISRTNEQSFAGDTMGALCSLIEERDNEGTELQYPIPTIVESFASIQVTILPSAINFELPTHSHTCLFLKVLV